MKPILIPLPRLDFDPTEVAVPWSILTKAGKNIIFATPDGQPACADERVLKGLGLGIFKRLLGADASTRKLYEELSISSQFKAPIKWSEVRVDDFDGLLLPGGHALGMREYLESAILQCVVSEFFKLERPVGAICHGVVLASRSKAHSKQSVLFGRKTTCLLALQELSAWVLTSAWLGRYYRTYPETVESEVKSALASSQDFIRGPLPLFRDSEAQPGRGFAVRDGKYISARWPGDAHTFASEFLKLLNGATDLKKPSCDLPST